MHEDSSERLRSGHTDLGCSSQNDCDGALHRVTGYSSSPLRTFRHCCPRGPKYHCVRRVIEIVVLAESSSKIPRCICACILRLAERLSGFRDDQCAPELFMNTQLAAAEKHSLQPRTMHCVRSTLMNERRQSALRPKLPQDTQQTASDTDRFRTCASPVRRCIEHI